MRIQAGSKLTPADVQEAVSLARKRGRDIWIQEISQGSRGAITFYCESHWGKYAIGRNDSQGHKAASWTSFGWVIAELFTRDPDAIIGQYRGRDHFIRSIYGAQRHFIQRQSLGAVRGNKGDYEHGEN